MLLIHGIITKDIGKPTMKPIAEPLIHLVKRLEEKPVLINVRTSDIERDIAKDINIPKMIVEYFLLIFIISADLGNLPDAYKEAPLLPSPPC